MHVRLAYPNLTLPNQTTIPFLYPDGATFPLAKYISGPQKYIWIKIMADNLPKKLIFNYFLADANNNPSYNLSHEKDTIILRGTK